MRTQLITDRKKKMSSHATISSNSNLHKVWLKNIRETFLLFLPPLTISHELAFALPGIFCMVKYIHQWKGFVSLGNVQFFKVLRDGDCHIAVFNSVRGPKLFGYYPN